ncbi:transcriptional regulator GcvA [Siculibacillus lacustris]|uniref:Transcriptional regulator GcvA n=1 Tax=Siculibacillus lacustris TaxID=1549641 RepID=A0A4Q9VKM7_9HYPH|nr:transcriptional regulator GcvA [Siculibacillus lacustris]TBW35482.1 transcriptional regulator GcvA [Siculibacillus lacustris]
MPAPFRTTGRPPPKPGRGSDVAAVAPPDFDDTPVERRINRLPPLNLFRVFDAVARHASFTAAADELCVTQSAVSQQIRQLEEFLEVRLFRRLPRKIELTREGTALANAAAEAIIMLSRACERMVDPDMPTVLCVSAAPSIASRWLVPRLKRFMKLNPRIKITLLTSTDPVDFERQDIDVAIRWGDGRWPGLSVELLGREPVFPVCSPALLAETADLGFPADLGGQVLLQVVNGQSWANWFEDAGIGGGAGGDALYFGDAGVMLEAAAQGHGIGLATYLLVEHDLKSGRLIRASEIESQADGGFYLLSNPNYAEKPAIAEFRRWIRLEAEEAIAAGACPRDA